ncbi:NfeD family protein [Nitrosococcus wardiae]|uniref:Nodulation protein NodD n=1 Tax=Nitrosococcus wardiae TaxID=1814290 RepID=A0A4P7BU97_9GAMM|nr:NfeD family protein [Nitrosococcus wardiae]QBQ53483.1 nodulation protein NodD [Nitrosococcus wardiae]
MVKQARVIGNVILLGAICSSLLWLRWRNIPTHLDALVLGILGGTIHGGFYWRRLFHRITRQDRRFGRNRIFVHYLSLFELLLAAATWSLYLLIALALLALAGFLLDLFSGHWWSIFMGSFGTTAALVLGGNIIRYERHNGTLYYQYDSRSWLGGEGLLYQRGKAVQPLTPKGKIMINGELWNAVSLNGENIEAGAYVEVISREGLTLYVDSLPQ